MRVIRLLMTTMMTILMNKHWLRPASAGAVPVHKIVDTLQHMSRLASSNDKGGMVP